MMRGRRFRISELCSQVEKEFGFPVASIIKLDDLVAYMEKGLYAGEGDDKDQVLSAMLAYRKEYGIKK